MKIELDVAGVIGEPAPLWQAFSRDHETVWVQHSARLEIFREAKRASDGLEVGGWLFQHAGTSDDTAIHVATGPGANAERGRDYITYDMNDVYAVEAELREAKIPLIRCGGWHLHPRDSAEPSPHDIASWARGLQTLEDKIGDDSPAWTGIILTSPPNDRDVAWLFPRFHGYVVRRDRGTGRLTIGRAQVREIPASR